MNYSSQKKVACIGIGGLGIYYVAKFFLQLGVKVYGFDIQESERTKELQALGATITFSNPDQPLDPGTSFFIYSPALPNNILAELEAKNKNIPHTDVGIFTTELIHAYEQNKLSPLEKSAFLESEIAPLFSLDQTKMKYIGVTGTDGKTTTCILIYHILKKLGCKPGLISTVTAKIGDKEIDTGFHTTTPSSQALYKFLKMMEEEGCTHAIVETTSHGLAMGRLAGLKFDAVAYTNITTEHLDYHKTWENYFLAKTSMLTEHTKPESVVVLNADDTRSYPKLLALAQEKSITTISYGETTSDLQATQIEDSPTISFFLNTHKVQVPIIGRYNISNALAAIGVVSNLTKKPTEEIAALLGDFESVTGRMQILQISPFSVIVDFAHTTNALDVALQAATLQKKEPINKVILVFGCAGKRDATKRVPMGQIAATLADITILTAEDPRSERLGDINDEISAGWKVRAPENHQLIRFDDESLLVDVRRQAIKTALELAKPGDVVLIAGKAHEQSLAFGTTEYPWNDIEETKVLLGQLVT